ncbi:MAG: NAD(P)-binding domain-containing protein [Verrucomicrobia bacterium]|nr:NAD(P)-binding domain-containing protein [Verrucomicrobiota bacterium]
MNIGILGGGQVAQRLGKLCAAAGHTVRLGLRNGQENVQGLAAGSLPEAARFGEIVLVALPFEAAKSELTRCAVELAGKVVVDCTNPVGADWEPLPLGPENSAGEEIARLLPGAHVVKAFNTIFADVMTAERLQQRRITTFVCGDTAEARSKVIELAGQCGFAPVDAGAMSSARYTEAMAHLNIRLAVALGGGTGAAFVYHRFDSGE